MAERLSVGDFRGNGGDCMKKDGPSEEAMRNFYKAVEPALIRIAKELREKEDKK